MSDIFILPNGAQYLVHVALTKGKANGLLPLIVTSSISCTAVVGLLLAIATSAFNTRKSKDQNLFVRTHVGAYFISLLCGDFFQAIGSIMNSRWYHAQAVDANEFCTAQGAIKHMSDVSNALWIFVIAVHTFCILFLEMKLKKYVLWATLVSGWSFVGAIVIAGPAVLDTHKRGPFFGISGYWCWISPQYPTERITLDYMIMFLSAFFSFVLYTLVFLRLRGNVIVNGWRVSFRRSTTSGSANWRERQAADHTLIIARQMLLYPVAYTILILPIAAARFTVAEGKNVSFGVTILCDTIFLLSGLVNVILFSTTRRILPPRSILGNFAISAPCLVQSTSMPGEPDPYYRSSSPSTIDDDKTYVDPASMFKNVQRLDSQDSHDLPIQERHVDPFPYHAEMFSPSQAYPNEAQERRLSHEDSSHQNSPRQDSPRQDSPRQDSPHQDSPYRNTDRDSRGSMYSLEMSPHEHPEHRSDDYDDEHSRQDLLFTHLEAQAHSPPHVNSRDTMHSMYSIYDSYGDVGHDDEQLTDIELGHDHRPGGTN